ncbi:MAG: hypothetical protein PHF17_11285 [Arcobacteraceae bacterium]|nr:hypothetical protein [Arcobacteraceae bacterium]
MEKVKEPIPFPNIAWDKDFPDGEFPLTPTGTGILVVAMDTEYRSNDTAYKNLCVSYQFSAYNLKDGNYRCGIFYPDVSKEERYSLGKFIKMVLEAMGIPISSLVNYRLIIVGHFFSAEWAMLEDREELFTKFEFIRKTLITKHSLKASITDENGEKVDLKVDFRDTMLLLPEGYKSLEKASTFIKGFEKVDLSSEIKQNMYQFLQDNPQSFEEYAIRDAEVTLRLFIKLQYLLNVINGTTDKLFSTLASASTTDFKNFSRTKIKGYNDRGAIGNVVYIHDMQFSRKYNLYLEYQSIADRSYLGGLNSSYHIGNAKGYTFLDIDFKNAYPTAMNLLKIGDFGYKPDPKKLPKIKLEGLK